MRHRTTVPIVGGREGRSREAASSSGAEHPFGPAEPATASFDWSQYESGDDRDMSEKAQRIRARRPFWSN